MKLNQQCKYKNTNERVCSLGRAPRLRNAQPSLSRPIVWQSDPASSSSSSNQYHGHHPIIIMDIIIFMIITTFLFIEIMDTWLAATVTTQRRNGAGPNISAKAFIIFKDNIPIWSRCSRSRMDKTDQIGLEWSMLVKTTTDYGKEQCLSKLVQDFRIFSADHDDLHVSSS